MRVNNGIPIFLDLGTNVPLSSDVCGTPLCISQLWWGRLQIETFGTDGEPIITIETSFDQVKWTPWNECSKIKLTDSITHIRMSELDGLWYRICINASESNNTTGTLNATLFIKELK